MGRDRTRTRGGGMLSKTVVLVALAACLALGQEPGGRGGRGGKGGPQPQATQQVKPGLYMITGAGANSEVRVTSEGLILVDGKLPGEPNYNALVEQIKMISPEPVKY